jgi:hypothetical protein
LLFGTKDELSPEKAEITGNPKDPSSLNRDRAWENILSGYPELQKKDIQAALYYARGALDHSEVRAVNA